VGKESSIVLEGPQVSLVCPSDETRVKTKVPECLEAVVRGRGR
jgi:hypothetical protein